jgi:hypothetical protein
MIGTKTVRAAHINLRERIFLNFVPLQLSIFRDIPPAEVCSHGDQDKENIPPDLLPEDPAELSERPTLLFPWVR